MSLGKTKRSLLLTPQGKVQGKFIVICAGENDFILLTDADLTSEAKSKLIADLLQFKVSDDVSVQEISGATFNEELRLILGEPAIGKELTERTIATDIDVTNYVSFNKGCYTGQETVEMSTARGRPNRALIHFHVAGEAPLAEGTEIKLKTPEGELAIGKISSSLYVPYLKRSFGLGFVKYDHRAEKNFTINDVTVERIAD